MLLVTKSMTPRKNLYYIIIKPREKNTKYKIMAYSLFHFTGCS